MAIQGAISIGKCQSISASFYGFNIHCFCMLTISTKGNSPFTINEKSILINFDFIITFFTNESFYFSFIFRTHNIYAGQDSLINNSKCFSHRRPTICGSGRHTSNSWLFSLEFNRTNTIMISEKRSSKIESPYPVRFYRD